MMPSKLECLSSENGQHYRKVSFYLLRLILSSRLKNVLKNRYSQKCYIKISSKIFYTVLNIPGAQHFGYH